MKTTAATKILKDANDYDAALAANDTRALTEIKGRYPLGHLPHDERVSEWIRAYGEMK